MSLILVLIIKFILYNENCFFDHPFHEKTKSSNFFLDIVNALGGVDVFYADFHNEKDTELLINKLCYQFDLLIFGK